MPNTYRTDRIGDLIRTELSTLLLREVRDPRIHHVTVTRVLMTKDLKQARVYYTVFTNEQGCLDANRALRRARSFLKKQLGQRLQLRNVPQLTFLYDDSGEQKNRVARLLDDIAAEHPQEFLDNEPRKS